MQDILMFGVFLIAGILCDILNRNCREGKIVITAYCLLTVCAMAVVISVGNGIEVPGPDKFLKATLNFFE